MRLRDWLYAALLLASFSFITGVLDGSERTAANKQFFTQGESQ